MKNIFVSISEPTDGATGYGLIFSDEEGMTVKTLCDVSTDYDLLLDFAEKCNRNSLAIQHIDDVIEDFLP